MIVFISSGQDELQNERDQLREFINTDEKLSESFVAKTFERDLSGRKDSVRNITEDWVLKSDVYIGLFAKKYSEPTKTEYDIAFKDKLVRKEIVICVKKLKKRNRKLKAFLKEAMDPERGHSCIIFENIQDLLDRVGNALLGYRRRMMEGTIISEDMLGPKLDGARQYDGFSEKLRRALLRPPLRHLVPKGSKGIPEWYRYDENGDRIDVTWQEIKDNPKIPAKIKAFYRDRYQKTFT